MIELFLTRELRCARPEADGARRRLLRAAQTTVNGVPWTDIPVEHLDLDQFDDDGNLRHRPYRAHDTIAEGR